MSKNSQKSRLGNIFFTLSVILLTLIIIALFCRVISMRSNSASTTKTPTQDNTVPATTAAQVAQTTDNADSSDFPPKEHMSEERRSLLQGSWNAYQLGESTLPEIKLDIDGKDIVGSVSFITIKGEMIYAEDDRIYIYCPDYDLYVCCELSVNSDGTPIPVPQKIIKDGKEEKLPIKIGALRMTKAR